MIEDHMMLVHYVKVPAGMLETDLDLIIPVGAAEGEERTLADVLEIAAWVRRNHGATVDELADMIEAIGER